MVKVVEIRKMTFYLNGQISPITPILFDRELNSRSSISLWALLLLCLILIFSIIFFTMPLYTILCKKRPSKKNPTCSKFPPIFTYFPITLKKAHKILLNALKMPSTFEQDPQICPKYFIIYSPNAPYLA